MFDIFMQQPNSNKYIKHSSTKNRKTKLKTASVGSEPKILGMMRHSAKPVRVVQWLRAPTLNPETLGSIPQGVIWLGEVIEEYNTRQFPCGLSKRPRTEESNTRQTIPRDCRSALKASGPPSHQFGTSVSPGQTREKKNRQVDRH